MVVGITGGIATGKTTVMRMLHERGAITFSADEASRAISIANGPVAWQIVRLFGSQFVSPSGEIDREALGRRIFSDPTARKSLNAVMHPRIRRLLRDQIRSAQDDFPSSRIIAVEVPLLYEGNMQSWFERIIVVTASVPVQIERLMLRNRLSEKEARARIASQMPTESKAAIATYVVVNDSDEAATAAQVDDAWNSLELEREPI